MSCVPAASTFRLLDAYTGWDPAPNADQGICGLDQPPGIELCNESPPDAAACRDRFHPRIASSCDPCEQYLVTVAPPASRLLRLDRCNGTWREPAPAAIGLLRDAVAVAAFNDLVGISDPGSSAVWLLRDHGQTLITRVSLAHPGPLVHAPWGEWLVVDTAQNRLLRLDRAGGQLGELDGELPGPVHWLAASACAIWLCTGDGELYRWQREQPGWRRPDAFEGLPVSNLQHLDANGFCLDAQGCWNWYGRAMPAPQQPTLVAQCATQGQLLTGALDSGIPRCRWHRVRIEAQVPAGTALEVSISVQEDPTPPQQGVEDAAWQGFETGLPHPADWQTAPPGSLDFLIDQPAGRYLFVRLRLTGNGSASPRVQRIRLDFPRTTSLDLLPAVYRKDPAAADFSERFLSIFDASLTDLDACISRFPALLDPAGVPESVLPWLGEFLDVAMDPAWDVERRREILAAVPGLYPQRGTLTGLRETLRLVLGLEVAIHELALERPWGAIGEIRLNGGVRLYGPAQARFRLGRSALSRAPLRSYGDPDIDPLLEAAQRIRVLVPGPLDADLQARLERLVEAQKPAHIQAEIHIGGTAGGILQVGTTLAPASVSVLGSQHHRLGRDTLLSSGARGAQSSPSHGVMP